MKLDYMTGITWGWCSPGFSYTTPEAEKSFRLMAERTKCNTVVIAFTAMQDNPHVTEVDFSQCPTEEQLNYVFSLAREYSMRIILKPTVDCRDGVWRGHIKFFDEDVPCEPKWSDWFSSYEKYQLHYAEIAERAGVDMLCVACEMVETQKRAKEWRALAAKIRAVYHGPLTWNCDKYQEDRVTFWDAFDVISASGYYPIDKWDENLDRIEKVVEKYNKPFLFIEAGCMSCKGSSMLPNSYSLFTEQRDKLGLSDEEAAKALVNLEEQDKYYKTMFEKCDKRDWINGFGLWDWPPVLQYSENGDEYKTHCSYSFYRKPAEETVKKYFIIRRNMNDRIR